MLSWVSPAADVAACSILDAAFARVFGQGQGSGVCGSWPKEYATARYLRDFFGVSWENSPREISGFHDEVVTRPKSLAWNKYPGGFFERVKQSRVEVATWTSATTPLFPVEGRRMIVKIGPCPDTCFCARDGVLRIYVHSSVACTLRCTVLSLKCCKSKIFCLPVSQMYQGSDK